MGVLGNISFLLYGSKNFGKKGFARASATWDNSVMERRLDGKVVMVTGANQGLGFETSQELARRGATLYMVCRNPQRGEEAVQKVRQASGNQDVHLQVCDVSSLASIDSLIREWEAANRPLHVLINNAGILVHEFQPSADGYESCFATSTLGPFALTRGLGPLLRRSGPPARVVFVSSGGMYTSPLEVRHVSNEDLRTGKYDGMVAYSRDKRRQVALAERFAELWGPEGVGVYSMHPGWATTEGVKKSIPGFYNFYRDSFRDVAQGADTIVWLALQVTLQDDASALQPGGFYLDRAPQTKHLRMAGTQYGKQHVDELWAALERMCVDKVKPAVVTPA
ncbi:hypothetical protein VOLCADRAFT_82077 [Volvox carteri f. nagariensis]|uniref:Dehydrogenase/reductase SDR family member 12 n=1 Tax=Volvox carteri f. nagariensis TaxID=3068 RepID=D8U317_VOLCA|nr:uncharacterized protein VOLCADRAFT_82077 [Volvox carteri f. nagariensis]EFJ45998.1 hypothetical protein VOLCADRAFT_82077 [Volvox carteri f. nagariensis]|eukprot:XP_002953076.1 hypothetical protein VOLCADRAFT_82077 [Volvox carteri f. nagariensis]